ncbi:H-type lectin domain-containing protein [Aliiroseovarius crassostreae]|uniref:H-type lectin domain-containing protein n=1 Tax=Aliiroseovarius crassostreae TaxID=154981 RepID=UPI002207196D|nr:H-type lectin domain-containing protein [Aliiroseovarius crassostreae]UWQ04026.1 H-type lectin domain-containing protein [Aliiroseovarius crassostreae]
MRTFDRNLLGVEQGSRVLFSDFEHDGDMWTGEGPREFRASVSFNGRFAEVPVVQVSMSMWDMSCNTNLRADICAENVTHQGFEIVFRTWGDTKVARIRADWLAMGPMPDPDNWDVE